jgi:hypothetical protein
MRGEIPGVLGKGRHSRLERLSALLGLSELLFDDNGVTAPILLKTELRAGEGEHMKGCGIRNKPSWRGDR